MTPDVLIAALPNLAEPSTLALGAAVGAFVGDTVGRLQRRDHEGRVRLSHDLGYAGFGVAFASYLLANILGGV